MRLVVVAYLIVFTSPAVADRELEARPCCTAPPVLHYEHTNPRPTELERNIQRELDFTYARHFSDCMSRHGVPRFELTLTFTRGAMGARGLATGPAAFRACIERSTWGSFGRAARSSTVRLRIGEPAPRTPKNRPRLPSRMTGPK